MDISNIIEQLNMTNYSLYFSQPLPIFIYLLIAFVAFRIPYVRGYLSLFHHLLHGMIKGIFERRLLNKSNGITIKKRRLASLKDTISIYAAYSGVSLAIVGLFYLIANQSFQFILLLFLVLVLLSVSQWIRRITSILWVLSFGTLLALPIYFNEPIVVMHLSIFLSSYLFVHSTFHALQLCTQSLLNRKDREVSGFLTRLKWIPSLLLGLILFSQSLLIGFFIETTILSFL
ncbi:hypothetical protein [Metabacillus malikii]|uniref:M50 family metallopeptidase n=1 Tax=Metabacillus malikii TaxID=1504265 RepID=A0ABT9ZHQ9_9BACI|nr:hypothetical protein [Metabacillus malikii]MDQ0231819.1 hypothetical protein [Metabacillus malikii]